MKAALLKNVNKIDIKDIPKPNDLGPNEVLIKIKMVGVCGSDIHYYTTGRIGNQVVKYPFIAGHEAAGIIEGVGSSVNNLFPGQRIAIDPAYYCGECDQCKAGRENTCEKLLFLGCPDQLEGALQEYIILDEKHCFPISDSTSFEQAVFSEPLAIAVYAVDRSPKIKNPSVAILGCGPIGLSVFHTLKVNNIGKVFVTDKINDRLKFAKNLNAAYIGNVNETDVVKEIKNLEPNLLDIVYECSGDEKAYEDAINLLKPGGTFIITGIPEVDHIQFPIHELRRKEITIINIRRQSHSTQKALDFLETGKINIDNLITHHFTLDQTAKAYDLVSNYRDGVIKAMITL